MDKNKFNEELYNNCLITNFVMNRVKYSLHIDRYDPNNRRNVKYNAVNLNTNEIDEHISNLVSIALKSKLPKNTLGKIRQRIEFTVYVKRILFLLGASVKVRLIGNNKCQESQFTISTTIGELCMNDKSVCKITMIKGTDSFIVNNSKYYIKK